MKCIGQTHVADLEALDAYLRRLPFGEPRHHLCYTPTELTGWQEGIPSPDMLARFAEGRLFGRDAELRWRRQRDGYALLWLAEIELPEEFTPLGDWEPTRPRRIYLFGSFRRDGVWRETRLPARLDYPDRVGESPRVETILYRDLATQTIRFTRFRRFVGKESSDGASIA